MLLLPKDLRIPSLLAAVLLTGCWQQDPIARYTVKKPELVDPTPVSSAGAKSAATEQEMLGAIVAVGETKWFFKLVGDPSAVEPRSEAFLALVKSVRFPAGSGSPAWTLPE